MSSSVRSISHQKISLPEKRIPTESKRIIVSLPAANTSLQKPVSMIKPAVPSASDTIFHYYKDGNLSVKESPWINGRRKIILYDRKGQITYVFDDVRMSYILSTTLQFNPDGSVQSSSTHNNPGASQYMYETKIEFKDDNIPSWKTELQIPQERLELPDRSYWNGHAWIKQEMIKEMETPH